MDEVPVATDAAPMQSSGATEDLGGLPLLVPVPKVARLLGISRSSAYRYAASGDLPTTQLGGRIYVVTSKLRQMLLSA